MTVEQSIINWWNSKRFQEWSWKMICYIIIAIGGIIILIPFFWMVSTSLKKMGDLFILPPVWIPYPMVWSNYIKGWTYLPFTLYTLNTIRIIIPGLIGTIFSSSLVAFGFSRLRFPGRDVLFLILLSTMMLPPQVTMIPVYLIFRDLNWIDTFKPLWVPSWFGGGAFFIFLLRQFFMSIPLELDDAARIDGCSTFGIYLRIIMPLTKPALAMVAIFSFMGLWNDFMGPLIYLNSMGKRTIALGLSACLGEMIFRDPHWELVMAISVTALLPCLLVFFFAQKYFIQGIVITGVKG